MRRSHRMSCAALLTFLGAFAGLAETARAAAGPPPGGQAPAGRPGRGPGSCDPRADEEMREAIEQVMLVRLKKVLAMTPEQEQRVMPRVEKLQEARRGFHDQRRAAVSHLRALMLDETARPDDLDKALKEVRSLEASFRHKEESMRAEIDQELDSRQRARLYFFEDHFRRQMQRRLHDSLLAGPGGAPPGGPARGPAPDAPSPDDDGDDEEP
jgi:hypothetical protein